MAERSKRKDENAEVVAEVLGVVRLLLSRNAAKFTKIDTTHLRHIKAALDEGISPEDLMAAIERFIKAERQNGQTLDQLDAAWMVPKAVEAWRVQKAVERKAASAPRHRRPPSGRSRSGCSRAASAGSSSKR